MPRYVCFKKRESDIGTWWQLTGAFSKSNPKAYLFYPPPNPGVENHAYTIMRAGEWHPSHLRTEHEEDDIPGEVWAALAKRALIGEDDE